MPAAFQAAVGFLKETTQGNLRIQNVLKGKESWEISVAATCSLSICVSPPQVTHYLLDKTLIIDEDTLYELSLKIEPRLPAWCARPAQGLQTALGHWTMHATA